MCCLWISVTSSHSEVLLVCITVHGTGSRSTAQQAAAAGSSRSAALNSARGHYKLSAGSHGCRQRNLERPTLQSGRWLSWTFDVPLKLSVWNFEQDVGRQTQQARDTRYVHCNPRRRGLA